MNINDFRYMRQGRQLRDLSLHEESLLRPLNQQGEQKERALLVLHGFSSSPAVYRYLLPQIKHYDALVCPTLPGHGADLAQFAKVCASEWLDTAQQHYAALSKDYAKVDVLALSLGGLLACELSKSCAINHLYLLAPALKLQMHTPLMLKIARLFRYLGFTHLRNAAGNILNPEHGEITYRKLPLNAIIEILQLVEAYQWQAPSCPVDLFLGSQDAVVNSQAVAEFFAPLDRASIHWLKNSAHVLPLDNDLDEIIQCINKPKT